MTFPFRKYLNVTINEDNTKKMSKKISISAAACLLAVFCTGCGLSLYNDWQQSKDKAIIGGGAVAGKDYIAGLTPSENSRKYFARISNDNQPLETIFRSDDKESKYGVRFVKNGGILIPPGVTISFENKGYCMDPHLPAPKAGDEYQLVSIAQLLPEDLQGIYKKLIAKASAGDELVQKNMQHLVWALRTAGTDSAFSNNLTPQQKLILNRCSDYEGQFEEFNANAKSSSKTLKELVGLADSLLNIKIGGVSYKASDLLDPDLGSKKINEHINQLLGMSKHLPVEKTGFNFGEIQPGIYTDIQGTGYLQYTAKIANSTSEEFIFYPSDYAGQVGSGTKSQGLTLFAAVNVSQRQRVTTENQNKIDVKNQSEPKEENPEEKICHCCKIDKKTTEKYITSLRNKYFLSVVCRTAQYTIFQFVDEITLGIGGSVLEGVVDGVETAMTTKDTIEMGKIIALTGYSYVSSELLLEMETRLKYDQVFSNVVVQQGYQVDRFMRNIKLLKQANSAFSVFQRINSVIEKVTKDMDNADRKSEKHLKKILELCKCHNCKGKCQAKLLYNYMHNMHINRK